MRRPTPNVTIRTHLEQRVIVGFLALFACLSLLFLVAVGLAVLNLLTPVLVVALVVALTLVPFVLLHFLRCPRCSGPLGSLIACFGPLASFARRITHCPFCGVHMDTHIEPQPTVQADTASPRGLT